MTIVTDDRNFPLPDNILWRLLAVCLLLTAVSFSPAIAEKVFIEADLPAGEVTLSLAKHEQKNCVGYVRHVDCLLLTRDDKLVPDHLPYGPQTLVRVTMGEGYDRPVYLHLFADHYRSPWYAHYAIGRDGIHQALAPPPDQMMQPGDVTPWCNLTPTVYQDSGAALNLSVRHAYHEKATHLRARLEFGRTSSAQTPPEQIEVIRTFDIEATPNGLVIIAPPDLESPQNIALLKRDQEFAEEVGKLADAFDWPKHGHRPVRIPFLACASISGYELPVDAAVTNREQQPLGYFGFNGAYNRIVHGAWDMKNNSYCQPDLDAMRDRVKHDAELFHTTGRKAAKLKATENHDQPEATNTTASTAAKLTNIDGIAPEVGERLERSHNPWPFSAAIGERILSPVRDMKLTASLTCDTPLVDAVELRCEHGILVALSNHTLNSPQCLNTGFVQPVKHAGQLSGLAIPIRRPQSKFSRVKRKTRESTPQFDQS